LDSAYVLLNRKVSNIKVLLKLTQIDPNIYVHMLIERKLYSTSLKICDFLLDINYEWLTKEYYEKLQREKGFYNFIIKRRYQVAREIFQEYKVPLQQVVILFSELFPLIYLERLKELFEIDLKEIPYYDLKKERGPGEFDEEFIEGVKEFLAYFLRARMKVVSEIEQAGIESKKGGG